MQLRLGAYYNSTPPDANWQRYEIGVKNEDGSIRRASEKEFETMKSFIPRIKAMGEAVLGSNFQSIRPELMDEYLLELFVAKGTSKGSHRFDFRAFIGWIELMALED